MQVQPGAAVIIATNLHKTHSNPWQGSGFIWYLTLTAVFLGPTEKEFKTLLAESFNTQFYK